MDSIKNDLMGSVKKEEPDNISDDFGDGDIGTEQESNPSSFDLSEFDDEFSDTEAFSFSEIPNGTYQVKVNKAFLDKSGSGNKLLRWVLEIVGDDYNGTELRKHNMIMTTGNLQFLKGDLEKAGADMSKKLSVLTNPTYLGNLIGNVIEVGVKNQQDNPPNIFFNKFIGEGSDTDDDDDLPDS